MNLKKLKQAEAAFFASYPQGFEDPEIRLIRKKHNMTRLVAQVQDSFAKARFKHSEAIVDDMVRYIGRSSMISLFEKPKFRDLVRSLNSVEREALAAGFNNLLHGKQQMGFEMVLSILQSRKLAKWSLLTILPVYFHPQHEVFVKPTTAKGVIKYFELSDLAYRPQPSWEFYEAYRRQILDMKSRVSPSLSPNNAAFTGFLMMSLRALKP
ncbi:MAG: hypothetical protein VX862_05380 [Pseudomonadota bacterium]|nr:hypothetical protein [Pseudomonadota bacterium]